MFFTEGGGSGEESDVLSINADDSDIEGPKEERAAKAVEEAAKGADGSGGGARGAGPPPPPAGSQPAESKKDIQSDIDKSVSEILALSATSHEAVAEEAQAAPTPPPSDICPPVPSRAPAAPSIQQLELLELEMRARAIKALMKASDGKKQSLAKNV